MCPGVSEDISSIFRFMDGHLYVFRWNIDYKYNELERIVISCPDKGLLEQLKSLLTRIIKLYEIKSYIFLLLRIQTDFITKLCFNYQNVIIILAIVNTSLCFSVNIFE